VRALFALVLLGACAGQPAVPVTRPVQPFNPVQYAVKHSVFLSESGCSAIAIGGGVTVTAKHCVPDDAEVGDAYEGGTLVWVDQVHDFAIFKTLVDSDAVLLRDAQLGEHLWVVGWPMQLGSGEQQLTVTDGVFAGPVDDDQERITAPVYFGNSGGGVWGDDGALLGVAVSIYAVRLEGFRPIPYTAQSFMVPSKYLRLAVL
jgi:S1-C subfamily serine protease